MQGSLWLSLLACGCQGASNAAQPRPPAVATSLDASVPPAASSTAGPEVVQAAAASAEVTAPVVSTRWTASGALAFATRTELFLADGPKWIVRRVPVEKGEPASREGRFTLLAEGFVDERPAGKSKTVAAVFDYAGKVLAEIEPGAFVFPSTRRKTFTACDAHYEHCRTTVSERTGAEWKALRTFDAAEMGDLGSETSPGEELLVRGGAGEYEVIAIASSRPPVRIPSPHNGMLTESPPPRFLPGFVAIPSRVGYRKVDTSGTVRATRAAAGPIPNGIITTDFDPGSNRLMFHTQMGITVFDLGSDALVGSYPSPPCDDPSGMCRAFVFDGRVFSDGVELDTKAKVWRKSSVLSGTPAERLASGETLFYREETVCFWLKPGTPSDTWAATPTFPCPAAPLESRPDGAFTRVLDRGALRVLDRKGAAVLTTGRHE
jgi:hypothetical protein